MAKSDNIKQGKVPHNHNRLQPDQLTWHCPEEIFSFDSTKQLIPLKGIVGQDRAIEAITMGAELFSHGYNVFVSGISGTGRLTTVKHILDNVNAACPPLYDYCFVHNFTNPDNPSLLKFARAQGKLFAKSIDDAMIFLKRRIPQLFEEEGFQKNRNELIANYQKTEQGLIGEFAENIRPSGFVLGQVENEAGETQSEIFPVVNKKPVHISDLDALVTAKKITKKKAELFKEQYNNLHNQLVALARKSLSLMQTFREQIAEYDKGAASVVIRTTFDDIQKKYPSEQVSSYIKSFEIDLLNNLDIFLPGTGNEEDDTEKPTEDEIKVKFSNYGVNVVLDNSNTECAPVIVETTPSFSNLFGTIEKIFDNRGFWRTDYTQIKAGSLLKADQGYLIVNALDIMTEPGVWPALKRLLLYGKLEIQSVDSYFQISQTMLKPEALDLRVKVIMIGDADIYHSFYFGEEDFKKIFKVNAEFDYETKRTGDMIHNYSQFIHQIAEQESLLHFDKSGVSAIIEWCVKHTNTQRNITLQFSDVADLVRESSFFGKKDAAHIVSRKHVTSAIKARRRRNDILDEKIRDQILSGTLMIETEGERIGQINGLTVYDTGLVSFGKPARITASVGVGNSGIINIERESSLSGSIHDKGLLILTGFLRERFAINHAVTLSASIAFEQSYDGIDGDSATAAEVIALLSSITGIPIKQTLAITGSMNQKGDIQAVGGINEKVLGFFELCHSNGFTGDQGVLVPSRNVSDLMLDEEIVSAVKSGKFHIYSIDTIEDAVELMLGMKAGNKNAEGIYIDGVFGKAALYVEQLHEKADTLKKGI